MKKISVVIMVMPALSTGCSGKKSSNSLLPLLFPLLNNTNTEYMVARQFATVSFDVSKDITGEVSSPSMKSVYRASDAEITDTVTGTLSGSADFTGMISSDREQGVIALNNFLSRQGFPVLQSGDLAIDFNVTDTTIKGSITSDSVVIDEKTVSLDIDYDLYLYNGLWRGKMTGSITIDNKTTNFSYDYDSPVLVSLTAVPLDANGQETIGDITDGGTVRIKLGVNSNAPVNWYNSMWNSPTTNLEGGGCGASFTNESTGYWTYQRDYTISKYKASGVYTWIISVENAAMLKSNDMTATINVANSMDSVSKPVITSVSITPETLPSGTGGTVTLTVNATSEAPVNWLNLILDGPSTNIEGGGSGVSFTDLGNNMYTHSRSWTFSKWAVNGTYTFSGISVGSEADLASDTYSNLTFIISNNPVAQTPVITSIIAKYYTSGQDPLTQGTNINGGTIVAATAEDPILLALIVTAISNAPVSWINYSFNGPTTNLLGGGNGINSTQIDDTTWQYIMTFSVQSPTYAPKGTYSWTNMSVGNEGQKTSQNYSGSLSFTLTN